MRSDDNHHSAATAGDRRPRSSIILGMIAVVGLCHQLLPIGSVVAQAKPSLGYPPTFLNHSGCLYAYMSDGGSYRVTFPEGGPTESQSGTLSKFVYGQATCLSTKEPGLLQINFEIEDNNFASMSIDFTLKSAPSDYGWEISGIKLSIVPSNGELFPSKDLQLRPASQIYTDMLHSYSCSSLVLTNAQSTGPQPQFRIVLKRFQIQPFHEPANTVFAPSRDCSTWLTMPQIMGFLFILFMISTVLIGVYLLLELGNHTGDLRFSKQGGMLMNQAQLDATKAD